MPAIRYEELLPEGALPSGKGELALFQPICGGVDQFFATGTGDDTQPDSLQAFQLKPGGAVPISNELDFPGPNCCDLPIRISAQGYCPESDDWKL